MQKIKEEQEKKDKNSKIRLMFCDEARFGLIDSKCKCWAPADVRPEIFMKIIRQYTYSYAAVSPKDGEMVSLVMPCANTDAMNIFLKEVSSRFASECVVMIMDQARWHKGKDLDLPENIRIEFLPPYSPQLNPTENIWDEVREKNFKNRYFEDMDQVESQLCKGLKKLEENPEKVASITSFSWILNAV